MEQFNLLIPDGKAVTCLDDLRSLTVNELKKILVSYNEKVSGNKADLILRSYAVFCRVKEGGSVHVDATSSSNRELPLCTYREIYSSKCGHLPWVSDLRGTPPFTFIQLYDYLVLRTSKYKHIFLKSTGYKKLKAFQFFYDGYIRKMMTAKDGDCTFIDVRMKASMKNILYKVLVILDSSGNVSNAACTCPAGSGLGGFGNCNHVGGVLFALEDFNRKGYQQCKEPVSCTSKLSAWNVPSSQSKSVSALPVDEMVLSKIKFGKDNDTKYMPKCHFFDPRAPQDRKVNDKDLQQLRVNLAAHSSNSCFFAFHDVPEDVLESTASLSITTTEVPSLSSSFQSSSVKLVNVDHSSDSVPFNDFYDISTPDFKEMMDLYCNDMHPLNQEEIEVIKYQTMGQASNNKWMQQRMYRITASNFYSAAANTVEPSSKLKSMYYSQFSSPSVEHGKFYEDHVKSLYLESMMDRGFANISVEDAGLIISSKFSFLGASLDGIVQSNGESWGLEIKCPYSKFNSSLASALDDKKFFLKKGAAVSLKKSHAYYYQVQGQMYCTGLKKIDFVVWFGSEEPLFISTIHYDKQFMEHYVLPKLTYFFCRAVLPEFFTKRVKRGLKLYLHGGWTNYESK